MNEALGYALAAAGGLVAGYIISLLFRKKPERKEYDLLVIVTPKGDFWVLTNATVQDDRISGTHPVTNAPISFSWKDETHPKDYVVEREEGGLRTGLLFAAEKDSALIPIMTVEEFVDYLKSRELVKRMEELLVQVQSAKMDEYSRFFDSYEILVKSFFSENLAEHMRAAGALCAKFPNLLDRFAEGFVVAKMGLSEEDRVQKEELVEWLSDPTTTLRCFAKMVAEELSQEFGQRVVEVILRSLEEKGVKGGGEK